ncbi:MAG TPA: ABC transporter substrate-binding protein [Clostridia bacterium]|nr:ABC transporter substrate-binding protein [Clostridia bacterium]
MKKLLATALAVIIILLPLGCRGGDSGQEELPTETPEQSLMPTLPPSLVQKPRDSLRVAGRLERDLNPLYPKHYATQSLLKLVYQPLYDIGLDGRLEPVLARDYRWSDDGLTLTVSLARDRHFHDGKVLQAADVIASFRTYLSVQLPAGSLVQEDPDDSPDDLIMEEVEREDLYEKRPLFQPLDFSLMNLDRLSALENIADIEALSDERLAIKLFSPDPLLPRLLTFPVLPQAHARERSMNPAPGTGSWTLIRDGEAAFSLKALEGKHQVMRIQVTTFGRIQEAVAAFEAGDIDLLLMDSSETALYADRSRIRKQRQEDGGFISLYFGGRGENALDMRDALLYVFQNDPAFDLIGAPLSGAFYPILSGDFRLKEGRLPVYLAPAPDQASLKQKDLDQDDSGRPQDSAYLPFRLLVPEDFLPARLIDRIGSALLQLGRQLTIIRASADNWQAALNSGQYDAALLVEALDGFPDPADYLDGLARAGLLDWSQLLDPADRAFLLDARQAMVRQGPGQGGAIEGYPDCLLRVFGQIPVLGLAVSGTMVWYSNHVEGSLIGTWYSPYLGVEDLLVWGP